MPFRIGVDLTGNDRASTELCQELLEDFCSLDSLLSSVEIVLFGTQETFLPWLDHPVLKKLQLVLSSETISMEESPLTALREKQEAPLVQGIRMLQKKELSAFISAANTGALLASAVLELPLLPGVIRPALIALLPTLSTQLAILDVGASLRSHTGHLVQLASMGIAYQKIRGIPHPRVGLLNVGLEKEKGPVELRQAYQQLQELSQAKSHPFFVGNIEAREALKEAVDVLVTDGFTGNIFLKTIEGTSRFALEQIEAAASAASILKPVLNTLYTRLHYTEYPGAVLCGVEGVVIKCHGEASTQAFIHSIQHALHLLERFFLQQLSTQLEEDQKSLRE